MYLNLKYLLLDINIPRWENLENIYELHATPNKILQRATESVYRFP